MERIKKIWIWVKPYLNKYVITIILFLVLVIFVDKNNLIKKSRYSRQIKDLQKEIRYYENERDESIRQLNDLRVGTQELEKIAREKYFMKKDDEEIFILEGMKWYEK